MGYRRASACHRVVLAARPKSRPPRSWGHASPARRVPEGPARAGRRPRSSRTDPCHRRSSRTVEGELTLSRAPGRVQTMVRRVSAASYPSRPHRPATNATTTGITGNRGPGYPVAGAQSGARFTVVCGSSAGSRGWKAAATLSEWAHGPATSVRGCHRQKGAPCALRETAVDVCLPYWPGGMCIQRCMVRVG